MKQKKLMLLGGIRYLLPVIEAAHKLGVYVITADYLPDNIAHKFSDEYVNVSIMDREAVLKIAQEKQIDGIMSFGVDPGVVTAAYVAEKMGLPFQCSYESACILQDKGRFRDFLSANGFNCPFHYSYEADESPVVGGDLRAPRNLDRTQMPFQIDFPVIVKPADSAGSKGCTRVDSVVDLPAAIAAARDNGHNGRIIVEEFLEFESYHSSADPFTIDGKLHAVSYSDQLFDKEADNPYTPAFIIWPSTMKQEHQDYLTHEIQRLMDLLHMRSGIYNIETVVGKGGIPYIMEVSPRGGGCKIAELQQLAFGANLIENEVRKAIGLPLTEIKTTPIKGHWCEMIVHSRPHQDGVFDRLEFREDIKSKNLRVIDMSTQRGDHVFPFTGANRSLGDLFLQFDTRAELDEAIADTTKWLEVKLS